LVNRNIWNSSLVNENKITFLKNAGNLILEVEKIPEFRYNTGAQSPLDKGKIFYHAYGIKYVCAKSFEKSTERVGVCF